MTKVYLEDKDIIEISRILETLNIKPEFLTSTEFDELKGKFWQLANM